MCEQKFVVEEAHSLLKINNGNITTNGKDKQMKVISSRLSPDVGNILHRL